MTMLFPAKPVGPQNSPTAKDSATPMSSLESHLLLRDTPSFNAYYNGKMSYALHGSLKWKEYVANAFAELGQTQTSENIYKAAIDLYAENLVPVPEKLRGFSNVLVPLLSRGECPVVVDSGGTPHFPEHYEMISDGRFTIAAIYTRDLEKMVDSVTFTYSNGKTRLFQKDVPPDLAAASKEGYKFVEEETATLFRFALDDKGFGASLAALQDRVNHSIIDQTIVAEMYARPFWYLLNVELPPTNPYLPNQPASEALKEHKTKGAAAGRIFTTSSEGPFGQLEPPTIQDMITYHDSIIDKVGQSTGIPGFYFKPGSGTPPTGVALKVLSKRFNNRVARIREDLEPELKRLADLLGVERTLEVKDVKAKPTKEFTGDQLEEPPTEEQPQMEYEFWNTSDDLLQESLDAHGISLSQMGYPLEYIAEVVTPGIDLEDYMDDGAADAKRQVVDGPVDMTAMGQPGLPATPGQVQAYAQNPGQRAARP